MGSSSITTSERKNDALAWIPDNPAALARGIAVMEQAVRLAEGQSRYTSAVREVAYNIQAIDSDRRVLAAETEVAVALIHARGTTALLQEGLNHEILKTQIGQARAYRRSRGESDDL